MGQQMIGEVSGISPDQARHVLAHFNAGGYHPGNFTRLLISAIAAADPSNKRKLALVFPGYVMAVRLAQDELDGIAQLAEVARGGVARGRWYPNMPPVFEGEALGSYYNRLTGADGEGREPFDHPRSKSCAVGIHGECADRGDRSGPAGESCECPCHEEQDGGEDRG